MKIFDWIGSLFGIKPQEVKQQEYQQGYIGETNPFATVSLGGEDYPILTDTPSELQQWQESLNTAPQLQGLTEVQKKQIGLRKLFGETFGYDTQRNFEQSLLESGMDETAILKEELKSYNNRFIEDRFQNDPNYEWIRKATPKAQAALLNQGYKSKSQIDEEMASEEVRKKASEKAHEGTTLLRMNSRTYEWPKQLQVDSNAQHSVIPSLDPTLQETQQYAKNLDDYRNKILEKNKEAFEFAQNVHNSDVKQQTLNSGRQEKWKEGLSKKDPNEVEQEFDTIAKAVNGKYAGTSGKDWRDSWLHDDLWEDLDGNDGYEKKLEILATYYAMAEIDPQAAQNQMENELNDMAYENTNFVYSTGKTANAIVNTTVGQTVGGLMTLADRIDYRKNEALYGEDEANRIIANRAMGKTDDWSPEKEQAELAAAKSEKEKQQIREKYNLPWYKSAKYWNDVTAYNTFSQATHNKIEQDYQGISPYNFVQPSTGPTVSNYLQEATVMGGQFLAQYAAGLGVSAGFTVGAKGLAWGLNAMKATGAATKAFNTLNTVGKVAAATIPSYQIAGSYGINNFAEAYQKNMHNIDTSVRQLTTRTLQDRFKTDPEIQAQVFARAQQLYNNQEQIEYVPDPRDYVQEQPSYNTENFADSNGKAIIDPVTAGRNQFGNYFDMAYNEFLYGDSELRDSITQEVLNSDYYKEAELNARKAAGSAAMQDATTELFKYGAFNALFRTYLMPKRVAAWERDAVAKVKTSLKQPFTKTDYGTLGEKVEQVSQGTYKLGGTPHGGWAASKAMLLGGGMTNYTDELQSAWAQQWNNKEFEELMQESQEDLFKTAESNPSNGLVPPLASYALAQTMKEGFTYGFNNAGYETDLGDMVLNRAQQGSSWDAFLVGTLGGLMPGINMRHIEAKMHGDYAGEKRFDSQSGRWLGKNVDPITGDIEPVKGLRKVFGNRGWLHWGFGQAYDEYYAERNRKQQGLETINEGLHNYVLPYIQQDAPELYKLMSLKQELDDSETPLEADAFKANLGFKLAALAGKIKTTLGEQNTEIDAVIENIQSVAERSAEEIEDSEIQSQLNTVLDKQKIDKKNPKNKQKIEEIKEELKQEYVENAKQWSSQYESIGKTYAEIDKAFGWTLTEEEKYDRAYKERMLETWENTAHEMEKQLTGKDKYAPINENYNPAVDTRNAEEIKKALDGDPESKNDAQKVGYRQELKTLKEAKKKSDTILDKATEIKIETDDIKELNDRETKIEEYLSKIDNQDTQEAVASLVYSDEAFILAKMTSVLNENRISSLENSIRKAEARSKYLKENPQARLLSAQEILNLSPEDRLFMINNIKSYDSSQRNEIRGALRQLKSQYKKATETSTAVSDGKIQHLLQKQLDIINNVELAKMQLQEQTRNLYSAKAERMAAVNMAKQLMFADMVPRVKAAMTSLGNSTDIYAYMHKMFTAGEQTAGNFDRILQYFEKYPDSRAAAMNRAIASYRKAIDIANDRTDDSISPADYNLLHAFIYASLEKDADIEMSKSNYKSAQEKEELESNKDNITQKSAAEILENLDTQFQDTQERTRAIVESVHRFLDENSTDYIDSVDNLREVLERAVQAENAKIEEEKQRKKQEKRNGQDKKKTKKDASAPVPSIPKAGPASTPSVTEAAVPLPETPLPPQETKPQPPKEVTQSSQNEEQTAAYNKVLEKLRDKNSYTYSYLFEKAFKRVQSKLSENQKLQLLNKVAENLNHFRLYSDLEATISKAIEDTEGVDNIPTLKALLRGVFNASSIKEAEEAAKKTVDDIIEGERIQVTQDEDNKGRIVPPAEGIMQSANMPFLSQFEFNGKTGTGIWHRFVSFGGREAVRKVRPGDTIYFLKETNDENSEIWLATKSDSPTSINGYQIVGLMSKTSNDPILQQQYQSLNALSKKTDNGWEILSEDNKPLTAVVDERFSARQITLKEDNKDAYIHQNIKEVLAREGVSEADIVTVLDKKVQKHTTEVGHQILRIGSHSDDAVITTKRLDRTSNKDGILLSAEVSSIHEFNKSTRYAATLFHNWLFSKDGHIGAIDKIKDPTSDLEMLASGLKSTLGKALHLPTNANFKIEVGQYSALKGKEFDIILEQEGVPPVVLLNYGTQLSDSGYNSEGGLADTFLHNLIFEENGEFRRKTDSSGEPLVMWQVDHEALDEETTRKNEIKRLLDDNLLETSQLFITPQIAGFTFKDPFAAESSSNIESSRAGKEDAQESGQLFKGPKSASVGPRAAAIADQLITKFHEAFSRYLAQLKDTTYSSVTRVIGKNTFNMTESQQAVVLGMGNNQDKFFRDIIDKVIVKGSEADNIPDTLDVYAGTLPNMTSEAWKTFYTQFQNTLNYIQTELIPQAGGLTFISVPKVGNKQGEIPIDGSIEVRDMEVSPETGKETGRVLRVGDLKIRGLIDMLAKGNDGKYYLFDFKLKRLGDTHTTFEDAPAEFRKKLQDDKEKWARQLNFYAKWLEKNYGIEIAGCYIIPTMGKYPYPEARSKETRTFKNVKKGGYEQIQVKDEKTDTFYNINPLELSYELKPEFITENLLGYRDPQHAEVGEYLDWIKLSELNEVTKTNESGDTYVVKDADKVVWRDPAQLESAQTTPPVDSGPKASAKTTPTSTNRAKRPGRSIPKQLKPQKPVQKESEELAQRKKDC